MEDIFTTLPNLSIGVVAVLGLVWTFHKVAERSQITSKHFLDEIAEREKAFRTFEREVRTNYAKQLSESTNTLARVSENLKENTRTMERVLNHLDRHGN